MEFGKKTPFILIARCKVKLNCLDDYLKAAKQADMLVKVSEPGMLHHTFDQDPEDEYSFVWSEVYKDDASLIFHLSNPPLVAFVDQHKKWGYDFSIEVYGTLAEETKEILNATGFKVKYYDTKFGYSRMSISDSGYCGFF